MSDLLHHPRTNERAQHYRDRWRWDRIAWASHCIDCYPGNCPMRVYVKDGIALREEQCGIMPVIENGVPDMNPMGCQKGVAWAGITYGIFDPVSSIDDWFHSELVFIWFSNPAYTRIPHQHYIKEARLASSGSPAGPNGTGH